MGNSTDKNNDAMVSDKEFKQLETVIKGMGKVSKKIPQMKMYRLDKGANRITDTMKGLHEDAKENSGSIDEMLSKFEKNQLRRQGGSNAESTQESAPNNETNKKETGDTGTSGNNNTGNGNDGGNSNGENTGNAGNKPGGTGNTGIGGNTGSEGSGNTGDSGTSGYKCSNSISWGGATECEWFDL